MFLYVSWKENEKSLKEMIRTPSLSFPSCQSRIPRRVEHCHTRLSTNQPGMPEESSTTFGGTYSVLEFRVFGTQVVMARRTNRGCPNGAWIGTRKRAEEDKKIPLPDGPS